MSVLTPLYLLGALAIVGPILFHLIRKTPRGEVPFSSLMFLSPTPPRLTRRSRIDDWLLLLLRAAALALLAFAFARPFLREAIAFDTGDSASQRVLVLIDTSASLRRGDLWQQALQTTEEAIQSLRPNDTLAVYAFDRTTRPLLTFAESESLESSRRIALAKSRLVNLKPTWNSTELGGALIESVGIIDDVDASTTDDSALPRRIVLISDLQEGSEIAALGTFEWPSNVELDLKAVKASDANAGLHRLADASVDAGADARTLRVQVTNEQGASQERFSLVWKDAKGASLGQPTEAFVPAGQSRVFQVTRPAGNAAPRALELVGDPFDFDNRLHLADEPERELTVLFVGDEPDDDPQGLLFYLRRVFEDSAEQSIKVVRHDPLVALSMDSPRSHPLVVVAASLPAENVATLREFMDAGGTVVCVVTTPDMAATANALTGAQLDPIEEVSRERDVMLGQISFRHPLFSQLAAAQYNDFTKIRFWKYRRVNDELLGETNVIARFENRDPAILETLVGQGRALLFTSGWNPDDSQLARSSKFVPLMLSLLNLSQPQATDLKDLHVGDAIPLSRMVNPAEGSSVTVTSPSGTPTVLASNAAFDATNEPGVYTVESGDVRTSFAVNLEPAETRTLPLPVETLEQSGIKIARGPAVARVDTQERRQMKNAELEGRQKLWRWIVLATIAVLVVETWLAGRLARPRRRQEEPVPT